MFAQLTAAEEARAFLEQVSTFEGRVGVSLGLLLVAVLLSAVVLPRLVTRFDRAMESRFASGMAADAAHLFGRYAPTTLGGLFLRMVQFLVLWTAAVALLLVWGRTGVLRDGKTFVAERFDVIGQITASVTLLFLAYVAARALADAVGNFSDQTEWMTDHQEEVVLRVSQLVLFTFAGLLLLSVWDSSPENLLVGAGFLGIVVGMAARQTIGSLIAGFVLMFSRPFTIGDWVQVGEEEGIVTDITIMNTRLENFDGEFVVIPNDRVADSAITNRSQKGLLRIRVDVGIDYDADPERARTVALEAINDLPEVVNSPGPQVFPKEFGDSAVILEARFWIDHPTPPRKWKATSAVISAIKGAYEREGITIPYPQRELSGRAGSGGFGVRETSVDRTGNGSATDGKPEANEQD